MVPTAEWDGELCLSGLGILQMGVEPVWGMNRVR